MATESTIEDILKDVPRFRILCVGRSGVGKSSLINKVFGISEAKASRYAPGDATIDQEFVSEENNYLVLHDSKGFEPGNDDNFDLAARFLRDRHNEKLLKDRLHAIWLCIETPRAGGRVLEEGDKKLLALADELQTPVVVVFTKYDMLVLSKYFEEEEEEDGADKETLHKRSEVNAAKSFAASVSSLEKTTATLRVTPPYINISVSKDYEKSIADLVDMTRGIVHEQLKGDAWVIWAIAQRASLPVKIAACLDKGINFYYRALSGSAPGVGDMLLWRCLAQVHQDIVTCWNFRDQDKILVGTEFQQSILYLVEEVCMQSPTTSSAPSLDRISNFVDLIKVSAIPIAPPVAILGLTYFFVKWVADTLLKRVPEVECVLMAYTVDLISVLKSLFDFTLQPHLAGATDWVALKEAFAAYERSNKRKEVHASCRSMYDRKDLSLTQESFRQRIKQLLEKSLGSDAMNVG